MPEKRRQNLPETDRGSCYNKEEWVEEFIDDKGALMKIWKQSFADVLQNRFFKNFRKFYRKTPVLEFPFNKFAGPKAGNFI